MMNGYAQSSSLVESIPPEYKKPPNYNHKPHPVAKPRRSLPVSHVTFKDATFV